MIKLHKIKTIKILILFLFKGALGEKIGETLIIPLRKTCSTTLYQCTIKKIVFSKKVKIIRIRPL